MASAKKLQPAARGMPGVRLRAAKKTIQPAKFSASCRMRTAGMEPPVTASMPASIQL